MSGQRRPAGRKRQDIEHQHQRMLFDWLRLQHPAIERDTFAVPNGGHRHGAVAGKLKAEGVKAGVPDVICMVPRHGWCGMALEMKKPDGVPSDISETQADWLERLRLRGYYTAVAFGFDRARWEFTRYLNGDVRRQ